ncbi:MAG: transcriptional regulator Spx [Streptococcaceae bacterium]|jgi:regulatory protein spx|nr:transcriptional regulator Spx [Streptococcaceae bacterium]
MIIIYTAPSCTSCRKAKEWLDNFDIPYIERNLAKESLSMLELQKILMMTDDGTQEIISQRSNAFRDLQINIEEISISELFHVLQDNIGLLRRPIMIDNKRIQIGYNEDEIRRFVPRKLRKLEMHYARMKAGI